MIIAAGAFVRPGFADDSSDAARAAINALRGTSSSSSSASQSVTRIQSGRAQSATATEQPTTTSTRYFQKSTTSAVPVQSGRTAVARDFQNKPSSQTLTPSRAISNRTNSSAPTTTRVVDSARANLSRSAVSGQTARTATRTIGNTRNSTISRAGVTPVASESNSTGGKSYTNCRETFYQCMDEFCANKNQQLKRCACSSRVNDFDDVQDQLNKVEDKMLDFNETLLTVNMDKEDAVAMNAATEGETAFQQTDKSDSKKVLDTIMTKLKSSSTDTSTDRDLTAISLSLNADSAFDTIDSTLGSSSTSKKGEELYNAALPVCLDIIAEVCDDDSIEIVKSAYQMAIEQDCNTVSKAYSARQETAREKVRESSALLDMSRLTDHQTRNSDDILACKKKMLDSLSESAVCGEGLSKCLDWSGKYIDPGTGQAILTDQLANLANTITKPVGDEKWVDVRDNSQFVTFLNSKKKYLEPAMANCEEISDRVWSDFLEDALAQIRLSQIQKLEDMRQSCTSLTTTCITGTADSIADFDSRALSVFGVYADLTVNEMCKNIQSACTALLNSSSGGEDWNTGINDIATDTTFDTIISTCMQVGKNCIIQQCKNTSGNFGLCESVNSVNRRNVLNREVCWDEVENCVADAGTSAIGKIITRSLPTTNSYSEWAGTFYQDNFSYLTISLSPDYSTGLTIYRSPYDICTGCEPTTDGSECQICRIAEKIWGSCEQEPSTLLSCSASGSTWNSQTGLCDGSSIPEYKINRILPSYSDTLLTWFATNTSSESALNNCYGTRCQIGFVWDDTNGGCVPARNLTSEGVICSAENKINVTSSWTNCCSGGVQDSFGNCCETTGITTANQRWVELGGTLTGTFFTDPIDSQTGDSSGYSNPIRLCLTEPVQLVAAEDSTYLFCVGTMTYEDGTPATGTAYDEDGTILTPHCDGKFMEIDTTTGLYLVPYAPTAGEISIQNFYKNTSESDECTYNPATSTWAGTGTCDKISGIPTNTDNNIFIKIGS